MGVADGEGLNNIGLLTCTTGRVTSVGPDHFYIDDGSGLSDTSGHVGLKVEAGGSVPPAQGAYVRVLGISACFRDGENLHRLIRATQVDEFGTVATPTFDPDGGDCISEQSVTIHCATEGATIRYTVNGDEPTESDPIVSGAVPLDVSPLTLKAKAWKAGWIPSNVTSADYSLKLPNPTFSPPGGTYSLPVSVTISCATAGATIYYTTDGSNPTESDPVVSGPIPVDASLTLKARAFKEGWCASDTESADYVISEIVATPTFEPDGGTYSSPQLVTVTCATTGATIHYTTNGNDPTESDDQVVSGDKVPVGHSLTLKARAWKNGLDPSAVKSATYAIDIPYEIAYIPPGDFLMGNSGVGDDATYGRGNELPQHWVYLSGYWIGKHHITRGEYRQFMDDGGYSDPAYWSTSTEAWAWKEANNRTQPDWWETSQCWGSPPGCFDQTDDHPVLGVIFYEAEAFCKWAGGELPTEAQWEKAARWDGHPRVYPWGDTWNPECSNNWDDSTYPGYQTAPVCSYSPDCDSPYGLCDMAGNLSDWCADWYQADYYSLTPPGGWVDPKGPYGNPENRRVIRGGDWGGTAPDEQRCAYRHGGHFAPTTTRGFRVAYD